MGPSGFRLDHRVICGIVEPGSRVLDLGCGEGELLSLLEEEKGARVQGIDLRDGAILECVKKGLSVFHGDIESGLREYPDACFDYVIFNQSLQEVRKIDELLHEGLRIGGKIIVGFPNFANFKARRMLFFQGRTPMTPALPYRWYDTPNLRFLSVSDFREFCREKGLRVLEAHYLGAGHIVRFWPNLRALNAIFVLAKGTIPPGGGANGRRGLGRKTRPDRRRNP